MQSIDRSSPGLDHARVPRHGPGSIDDRGSRIQLTLELYADFRRSRSRSVLRPTACRSPVQIVGWCHGGLELLRAAEWCEQVIRTWRQ